MEYHENICPLFGGGVRSCRRRCGSANAQAPDNGCPENGHCVSGHDALAGHPLAMVYSPEQAFDDLYEPDEGLARGTVFVALEFPFEGDGRCR